MKKIIILALVLITGLGCFAQDTIINGRPGFTKVKSGQIKGSPMMPYGEHTKADLKKFATSDSEKGRAIADYYLDATGEDEIEEVFDHSKVVIKKLSDNEYFNSCWVSNSIPILFYPGVAYEGRFLEYTSPIDGAKIILSKMWCGGNPIVLRSILKIGKDDEPFVPEETDTTVVIKKDSLRLKGKDHVVDTIHEKYYIVYNNTCCDKYYYGDGQEYAPAYYCYVSPYYTNQSLWLSWGVVSYSSYPYFQQNHHCNILYKDDYHSTFIDNRSYSYTENNYYYGKRENMGTGHAQDPEQPNGRSIGGRAQDPEQPNGRVQNSSTGKSVNTSTANSSKNLFHRASLENNTGKTSQRSASVAENRNQMSSPIERSAPSNPNAYQQARELTRAIVVPVSPQRSNGSGGSYSSPERPSGSQNRTLNPQEGRNSGGSSSAVRSPSQGLGSSQNRTLNPQEGRNSGGSSSAVRSSVSQNTTPRPVISGGGKAGRSSAISHARSK